jgi:hypothetical protein
LPARQRPRTTDGPDEDAIAAYWEIAFATEPSPLTTPTPIEASDETPKPKPKPKTYYKRVFPQHDPAFVAQQRKRNDPEEAQQFWSQTLQDRVNEVAAAVREGTQDNRISIGTCRRLVKTCGILITKKLLHVLETRTNIKDPAAFTVTFMESEARLRQRRRQDHDGTQP